MRAQRGGQPLADGGQQLVTGRVAERVVDHFKVIDVDEQDADHPAGTAHPGDRVRHPFGEQHPVRQARQRVVERLVAQLVFEPAPLGDIPQRHHQPVYRRVGAQVAAGHLQLYRAAVVAPAGQLGAGGVFL